MCLQTWQDEFYLRTAYAVSDKGWDECLDHSIRKWEGLLPENLAKHDVSLLHGIYSIPWVVDDYTESQGTGFYIDADTCALCAKARVVYEDDDPVDWVEKNMCDYCPLAKSLGRPCSIMDDPGPYDVFYETLNPLPMLEALKNARSKA